ncbi:MAG: phosphomethylpyrimidine synthase, partial [Bacteroidales bacterium]|nr:phosphomethylpyrimidine synthase [Bacteroidales bacterium]
MKENIKIKFPNSEKVYMQGKLFPDIKVGMRKVTLTPTVDIREDGTKSIKENQPV